MLRFLKNIIFLRFTIFLWIFFIFFPVKLYALPSNKILQPSFHKSPQNETIEIQTEREPFFNAVKFDNPKRIVITIKNSYFPKVHYSERIEGEKINQLRISQNTKNQTRLVIDLIKDTDYQTKITQLNNGLYLLKIDIPTGNMHSIQTVNTIRPVSVEPVESSTELTDKDKPVQPEDQTIVMLDNSKLDDAIFGENAEAELKEDKNELSFSGSIQLRSSFDIDHDKTNENKTSLKNRIILKADYKNMITLSMLSDYLFFGQENETDDYDLDFYEAYFKHNINSFDITIGKQIRRWGKTDQISPIDTLNPENITEFIIPSYEERKIPVWMADLIFRKNNFFIEGIFIPFFEPSKFDYFGTDWAIFSHLKDDIKDFPLSSSQKSYFDSISVRQTEPNDGSDSFEYALRLGGTIKQVDFGFTYHYANEDLPCFQSFPIKNLSLENSNSIQSLISNPGSSILTNEKIETKFLRTNIFGFEFETIQSDLGIRGEAAFKDNESFMTGSFTSVRNPTLFWIIGADYTSLNNWYFNLQFGHQHISDYDSSTLFFDKDNYSVIGEINKDLFPDLFSDWLNAAFQYTVMLNDNSYYLSPRLAYTYIENLEMTLGINMFEGSDNSIFGRYDLNDQVFIDLKYHF